MTHRLIDFLNTSPDYNYQLLANLIIPGKLPSLKNGRRIIYQHGKPRLIKSQDATEYASLFASYVPSSLLGLAAGSLKEDLAIVIEVHYKDRKPDLSVEMLFDCLKYDDVKIISDDRYIRECYSFGYVDAENPRTQFWLYSRSKKKQGGIID